MPEIGSTLREARMRAGIDISEIEAETKIRAKYLRALENEEWNLLPGPTFVKSFLRTYADALDLDSKLLLEEYKLRHERPSDHELLPIGPPTRRRPEPRGIPRSWVIGVIVLALLVTLYALGSSGDDDSDPNRPSTLAGQAPAQTTTAATERRQTRSSRRRRGSTASPSRRLVRLQILPTAAVYVCLEAAGDRRLIDMLERRGVISGYEGSKPRQVLGAEGDVERFLANLREREGGRPEPAPEPDAEPTTVPE